jgi:hypothetical protein
LPVRLRQRDDLLLLLRRRVHKELQPLFSVHALQKRHAVPLPRLPLRRPVRCGRAHGAVPVRPFLPAL